MRAAKPTVSVTDNALVIRIPWNSVAILESKLPLRKRQLKIQNVLELVDAGRRAHRLGKTRSIRSLKELVS